MNKTQNQSTFLLGSALRLSVWLIYDLSFKLFYIYKMLSLVFWTKQIPGTLVKVWYQSDDTSKSKLSTYQSIQEIMQFQWKLELQVLTDTFFITLWKMEKRKLHIYFLTKQKPY